MQATCTSCIYMQTNKFHPPPPNKKIAMEIDIMRPQINLIKYNIIKLNKV